MRLFMTGGAGFLGTAVRRALADTDHEVVALTRSTNPPTDHAGRGSGPGAEQTRWVTGDIREPAGWAHELAGFDGVVHLAASLEGAAADQYAVAVDGTRALVDAMGTADVDRLVHISSFAVYDFAALATGAVVDETTPLETDPTRRDAYTAAKLAQEHEAQRAPSVVILRPGLIWDHDHHWDGGAAFGLGGKLSITISAHARIPIVHVDDCARAVVAAIDRPEVSGAINLVDPAAPDRAGWTERLRAEGVNLAPTVPVAYRPVEAAAQIAWRVAGPLGLRDRLPGLARPAQVAARFKPLRYRADRARRELNWP